MPSVIRLPTFSANIILTEDSKAFFLKNGICPKETAAGPDLRL